MARTALATTAKTSPLLRSRAMSAAGQRRSGGVARTMGSVVISTTQMIPPRTNGRAPSGVRDRCGPEPTLPPMTGRTLIASAHQEGDRCADRANTPWPRGPCGAPSGRGRHRPPAAEDRHVRTGPPGFRGRRQHPGDGSPVRRERRSPLLVALAPDCAHGARAAAHSSRSACTKACGRLPRSSRWRTSYSSESSPDGPHDALVRSNQRSASRGLPAT